VKLIRQSLVWVLLLACCSFALAQELKTEEDFRQLLVEAWGPETPETLEAFLKVREGIQESYLKHEVPIQQWALREASTMPTIGPSIFAVLNIAREVRDLCEEHGLSYRDYQRLTYLVYGRWLRAVREEKPREALLVRVLQELEIGLARRIDNNPPEDERELQKLHTRLASVRHQIEFVQPFAFKDKQAVLEHIDPVTKTWLEQERERIEGLDFRFFDTAPPPRDREE